jgi:tetratricopeptide (TPR) repeat protein
MEQDNRISGIFSRKGTLTVGCGATRHAARSESYWFVKEQPSGQFQVQGLDMEFKPRGEPFAIGREQLFEEYHLEPDLSYRLLSQPLLIGDHYRAAARHASAEQEYLKIKRIDEDNIRANFGLGLVYLALEKTDKAAYIFDRLVRLEETFDPVHKHLFNEFGINLRKKGLYEEALKYYFKARELSPSDDHVLLNIARVYFEQGRLTEAEAAAREALALNPGLAEAERLLTRIWDSAPREQPLPGL